MFIYVCMFIFGNIIREFMRLEMKSLKGIRFKNFNKSTGVPGMRDLPIYQDCRARDRKIV